MMKWRVVGSTASGPGGRVRLQRLGDQREGTLVLVPGPDVGLDLQGFLDRGHFEERRDDDGLPGGRNQRGGGALGAPPADAGEVFERRAGFDEDCGDPLLP